VIAWMLYTLLAAGLVAGAALAADEAARLLGRPRRWAWTGGMIAAAALPMVYRLLPPALVPAPRGEAIDPAALADLMARAPGTEAHVGMLDAILAFRGADPFLQTLWIATAVAMLGALFLTYRRLRRVRASAARVEIGGVPALLTRSTGPMVVGVRRPEVVVPRWISTLSEEEQRLVIRHEWEHVRAGDTRLLMASALLVAAMPWNLPLWWMRVRLRQAVEVDCDARVLAAGADRRLYGTMLIRTAGRPGPTHLLAPALVELPSLLERRIVAMTSKSPSHRTLRLGVAAVLAVALFTAACELTPRGSSPSPTEPTLAEVLDGEESAGGTLEGEVAVEGHAAPVDALVITSKGPGSMMVTADGDTLRATTIRLRTSLGALSTGSAEPLIIVDGSRATSLSELDPNRIVSIDVFKGSSATDLYGPEAADGAVVVTTGEPSAPRLRTPRPARAPSVPEALPAVGVTISPSIVPATAGESPVSVRIAPAEPARVGAAPRETPVAVAPNTRARAQTVEGIVAVGYGTQARAPAAALRLEGVATVGYGVAEAAEAVSRNVESVEAVGYGVAEATRAMPRRISGVAAVGYGTAEATRAAGESVEGVVAVVQGSTANFRRTRAVPLTGDVSIGRGSVSRARVTDPSVERISTDGGGPGILLRAASGDAPPLVLVDGRKIDSLEEIDPDSVASIQVLKDRAATALYGPEGANGVVLVTLRK
jgi:TonB-dependent SusC/RagA subfamily outer membrane receptor